MELYRKHLAPFADRELSEAEAAELSSIRRLAPGDFHTVHSKLWMEEPNSVPAGHIISLLRAEADLKSEKSVRRIGFSIS